MGLTEQLQKIVAEFGHLLPGHHIKTLQEAGEALAVEPDSETPAPSYVSPEIPVEDQQGGAAFEASAEQQVAQFGVDDEALLAQNPVPDPAPPPIANPDPTPAAEPSSTSTEGSSAGGSTPSEPATSSDPPVAAP